jgi:glycosyltransferase involved in cell wall biosynthesis
MKVLIATDAWLPQINGVVNTYLNLARHSAQAGFDVEFLTPEGYRTFPLPTYPEIRLALIGPQSVGKVVRRHSPDAVHIATEGPLGLAARRYCLREGLRFTTSYHTRFPEYLAARFPVPLPWGYRYERWFHNAGAGVMAATPSLCSELSAHGLRNVRLWSRGVDTQLFRPRPPARFEGLPRPIFLYVGRVAVEKNIESFLKLSLPGTKAVVGSGPQLDELRAKYRDVIFTGPKSGQDLAEHYSAADVFVFPSLTDTFGNVMLEALASGLPVAAFPVIGPKDVIRHGEVGILCGNLQESALAALALSRETCRTYAESFGWESCARKFAANLHPARGSGV